MAQKIENVSSCCGARKVRLSGFLVCEKCTRQIKQEDPADRYAPHMFDHHSHVFDKGDYDDN